MFLIVSYLRSPRELIFHIIELPIYLKHMKCEYLLHQTMHVGITYIWQQQWKWTTIFLPATASSATFTCCFIKSLASSNLSLRCLIFSSTNANGFDSWGWSDIDAYLVYHIQSIDHHDAQPIITRHNLSKLECGHCLYTFFTRLLTSP